MSFNISSLSYLEKLLLADILGLEINKLYFDNYTPSPSQKQKFDKKNKLFKQGYPLDYLLSKIDFLDLNINVEEGLFIPRPETEQWVKKSIIDNKLEIERADFIVDMCSGTGVIGLYIAKNFPKKRVFCVDSDEFAITNIKNNSGLNKITNVEIFYSNLFDNLDLKSCFVSTTNWILFCNPPYVPTIDLSEKDNNNILFEPEQAIFSGISGLNLFNQLLDQLILLPVLPKICLFELDPRNIQSAKEKLGRIYANTFINKDFNGFDRVLIAQAKD